MKKNYENAKAIIVYFSDDDVITTSQYDNKAEYPDFPENFTPQS